MFLWTGHWSNIALMETWYVFYRCRTILGAPRSELDGCSVGRRPLLSVGKSVDFTSRISH